MSDAARAKELAERLRATLQPDDRRGKVCSIFADEWEQLADTALAFAAEQTAAKDAIDRAEAAEQQAAGLRALVGKMRAYLDDQAHMERLLIAVEREKEGMGLSRRELMLSGTGAVVAELVRIFLAQTPDAQAGETR